jgi:hypothetical protein
MADHFLDENAAGAGTGADWTNAFTVMTTALAAAAAGDTIYVASDHAETAGGGSAITLTSAGTAAAPVRMLCVDKTGSQSSADLRTTATITTTNASNITYAGHMYVYGVQFTAGSGANNAHHVLTAQRWIFDNCKLILGGTTVTGQIQLGNASANTATNIGFINTQFKFNNTTQSIALTGGHCFWRDTPTDGVDPTGSIPTNLIIGNTSSLRMCVFDIEGVDLSASAGGKTIVGASNSAQHVRYVRSNPNRRWGKNAVHPLW